MSKDIRRAMIATPDGMREAHLHATFTRSINGRRFGFSVTESEGGMPTVTHRKSGRAVCLVPYRINLIVNCGYATVADMALGEFIERIGEAKVCQVLADAEDSGAV